MKNKIPGLKSTIGRRIIVLEIIGFLLVIAVSWITAIFDPPYLLLSEPFKLSVSFKPVDMLETSFVTVVIVIVALVIMLVTRRVIGRIKYLEGFMLVCASCKKVKVDEKWVQIEKVISDKSDLIFSHGICPTCAAELYPEIYDSN